MIISKPGFYKTRDGRKVEILKTSLSDKQYPVMGVMDDGQGNVDSEIFTKDGRYYEYRTDPSGMDLVSEWPEEIVAWALVGPDAVTYFYPREDQAKAALLICSERSTGRILVKLTGTLPQAPSGEDLVETALNKGGGI